MNAAEGGADGSTSCMGESGSVLKDEALDGEIDIDTESSAALGSVRLARKWREERKTPFRGLIEASFRALYCCIL